MDKSRLPLLYTRKHILQTCSYMHLHSTSSVLQYAVFAGYNVDVDHAELLCQRRALEGLAGAGVLDDHLLAGARCCSDWT